MKNKNIAVIISVIAILFSVIYVMNKDLSNVSDVTSLGQSLDIVTFVPTILAVVLAFVTKNVIISLLVGFLTGSIIATIATGNNFLSFFSITYDTISGVIFDSGNIATIILCLLLGGLVEVVKQSGGFEAIAHRLEKNINTSSKANLMGVILGCGIFFDDYANAMVLGPVMTRFGKKLKIAKEKIAYIVNSTSAPVSGTCFLSTWAAVEISCISKGLSATNFTLNTFELLKNCYGFTFYCMFTITSIVIGALLKRDFGPMYQAEIKARNKVKKYSPDLLSGDYQTKLFVGTGSIVVLVIASMILIVFSGRNLAIQQNVLTINSPLSIKNLFLAIAYADSVKMIIMGIIFALVFVVVALVTKSIMDIKQIKHHFVNGLKKMMDTVTILILAWSLADIMKQLGTVYYAVDLISMNVSWKVVPVLLLLCCCIISTASGSYGAMFVTMPLALPIAQHMIGLGIGINADVYLYLIIACVISGSIFGDACSPISDCVTLTSESVDVGSTSIVATTIIYSFVNLAISIVAILLVISGLSNILVIVIGVLIQLLMYLVFGKKIEEK